MLAIGEIVAAHGLRGQVRVSLLTDFPERLGRLREVWVSPPNQKRRRRRIRSVAGHPTKPLVILGLEGIDGREQARGLVGALLEVEDDEAVELPEGAYFEHDIVGLRVVTTEGQELGEITEIIRTGANDVYVTAKCLIPAISDVVLEIDLEAGRVLINAIPGLLDE